ncbi:MAG: SDR family oxidoreductase [Pyrinomonadaceae bacterium]
MLYRESIFITGFPGFIAGRLFEHLIKPETQFFVLVQPQFVQKAMIELEEIAELRQIPVESFVIVEGDITLPNLGISNDDLQTIQYETTDVFHLAAAYDLGVSKDVAFNVNLEGTKHVNDLVCSIKNLHRYNYVSTCYVAGNRTGVILETELEHKAGFRNFYEETKYLAEIEVEKLKSHLPVTIFRPSVVVGDSITGETVKYDGIYYLINYLRKAPAILRLLNIGNPSVRLNLVPVDFVVKSIAALSQDPITIGKTIAIADPAPMTTSEIFDVIAKDLSGRRSEFQLPMRIAEWFLHTGISPAITGLPHHGVPYFFLSQTYDTSLANELLPLHGIACPRFDTYAGNLMDFVYEKPKL